jgi:hypothetical protein
LSDDDKQRFIHQIGKIDRRMSIQLITGMITSLCSVARDVALNINPQILLEKWSVESIMLFAKLDRELAAVDETEKAKTGIPVPKGVAKT